MTHAHGPGRDPHGYTDAHRETQAETQKAGTGGGVKI